MREGSAAGEAAIIASNSEFVEASPQGTFALDQVCLKRCGFPESGAPGDGLAELPDHFKVLFGLGKGHWDESEKVQKDT
jgi:hypothetical protein